MLSSARVFALCLATILLAISSSRALEINTPKLAQCQNAFLSWEGKFAPFNVSIIDQKNGTVQRAFGLQQGYNLTWTVDIPARRNVALRVRDSKGTINYSAGVWVANGTDASCLHDSYGGVVQGIPGSGANATSTVAISSPNATLPAHTAGIGGNAATTNSASSLHAQASFAIAIVTVSLLAMLVI